MREKNMMQNCDELIQHQGLRRKVITHMWFIRMIKVEYGSWDSYDWRDRSWFDPAW